MLNRAYSTFLIKSIDEEQRIVVGIASTPSTDRSGDEMDPKGAQFTLPMPFKWQHKEAVGEVFAANVTPYGIEIQARVVKVPEPGLLRDIVDFAWQSIKLKLARGLSIGWHPIEAEPNRKGGLKVSKWGWYETSAVYIPMNAGCTIASVKSFDSIDTERPAATGTGRPVVRLLPGATGSRTGDSMKTTSDQIASFEATRAAKSARMTEIMNTAGDQGVTLDAAQEEEYDGLETEVKSLDAHLTRLASAEKANKLAAKPVNGDSPTAASESRGVLPVVQVKTMAPKGTAFIRMCMALASSKGDSYQAMERAKSYHDMPEVELLTKAAIAAGTTTDATWAGPLAVAQPLVDEFLEMLRPRTLLGRIPGLRQVPFNISVPSQTTGGTYGWVGQNKPKPVTKADFATISVPFNKAAGIIVLTEELVKLSSPSAEALVREEMIAGMGQFLDVQFNDPAVAVSAGVNPASITNGASTAAASGVTGAAAKADLAASIAVFTAAGMPLDGSVWLMNDSNAWGLSIAVNALGQPLFPGMTAMGGTLMGLPVVVSNNLSTRVVLVHAPSILYADEGGVRIDVSREASIQMDSAPTDTVDATTVYISLWQRNLVGLRAERMITWIRARTAAVRYITAAAYIGT